MAAPSRKRGHKSIIGKSCHSHGVTTGPVSAEKLSPCYISRKSVTLPPIQGGYSTTHKPRRVLNGKDELGYGAMLAQISVTLVDVATGQGTCLMWIGAFEGPVTAQMAKGACAPHGAFTIFVPQSFVLATVKATWHILDWFSLVWQGGLGKGRHHQGGGVTKDPH